MTQNNITNLATKFTIFKTKLEAKEQALDAKINELEKLELREKLTTDAVSLCQKCIGDKTNINAHVEQAITYLIQSVFPDKDMKYHLVPVYKQDKVTIGGYKHMIEEYGEMLKPTSDGLKDVIATGYRQLALLFSPSLTPFQFYDEPCPHLNAKRLPGLIEFTKNLQEQQDFSFAFITHASVDPDSGVQKYRVVKTGDTSTIIKQ